MFPAGGSTAAKYGWYDTIAWKLFCYLCNWQFHKINVTQIYPSIYPTISQNKILQFESVNLAVLLKKDW